MKTDAALIPCFPDFVPLSLGFVDSLHPRLSLTIDGVSEFTFSGLYLFRDKYHYKISLNNGGFIISGEDKSGAFFMTPCDAPDRGTLTALFETHDYWKNISDAVYASLYEKHPDMEILITEDRNNYDYLYNRDDLAQLSGKKYHKKKNLVNQFLNSYNDFELRPMTSALVPAAVEVLDRWRDIKGDGDYSPAREALEFFDSLKLHGAVLFVAGKPAAWCLGESIARGRMFVIHFEKAIDEYKGIYQFLNQVFAASLPRFFSWINREQDLGNEGLRQAKMTYRPCGFVIKYQGRKT